MLPPQAIAVITEKKYPKKHNRKLKRDSQRPQAVTALELSPHQIHTPSVEKT